MCMHFEAIEAIFEAAHSVCMHLCMHSIKHLVCARTTVTVSTPSSWIGLKVAWH